MVPEGSMSKNGWRSVISNPVMMFYCKDVLVCWSIGMMRVPIS